MNNNTDQQGLIGEDLDERYIVDPLRSFAMASIIVDPVLDEPGGALGDLRFTLLGSASVIWELYLRIYVRGRLITHVC